MAEGKDTGSASELQIRPTEQAEVLKTVVMPHSLT